MNLGRPSLVGMSLVWTTAVRMGGVHARSSALGWRRERPESRVGICPVRWRGRSARLFWRHCRRVIFTASRPGWNRRAGAEIAGPGGRRDRGTSMIFRREVLPILAREPLVLALGRNRSNVPFVYGQFFLPRRTRLNSSGSTVVADIPGIVHHHGSVVDTGHVRDADIGHRAVVIEVSSTPLPAHKSHARIAESVVNSSVKTDVRTPVAGMPCIKSTAPTPVSGRPQHAYRRHYPSARHPVVAVVIVPGPVPGRPEVAGARTDRLRVNRQRRRPDAHRDANRDLRKRSARKRQNDDCQQ